MSRKYFDDCMCAYADVYDGEKPLMIVSEGKSPLAYETIAMMAERSNLWVELAMLRCEDGMLHEHAFIGRRNIVPGETNPAHRAVDLVLDCKEGRISRSRLQYELGLLLGYTLDDTVDFIASKVARECPCDCCGGPFVSEAITG